MSLHLGKLSSRVQRDDLRRVFDRFGKNRLDIRDGYGFVVYDFPINAENALRCLRGKFICGERISVTWSNIQPRSSHRVTNKGSKFYEPYNRRGFGRREVEVDDVLPVESNGGDGRWGEPVSECDNKEVGDYVGIEIDKPYRSNDRGDEANSDVSSARGRLGEELRKGRDVDTTRIDGADSEDTCWIKTFALRGREGDGDVSFSCRSKREVKRVIPASRGRSDCTRTPSPSRFKKRDKDLVGSKETVRLRKDTISLSAKGCKYRRMKKHKKEDGESVKEGKKSRRESLSPQRSGSAARTWMSPKSQGTRTASGLKSKSSSSRTHSTSSSSRSMSKLLKLRPENARLKSKSISPEALSLPVVPSQPLRSSSNKIGIEEAGTNSENHLEEDNGSAPEQSLIDQIQLTGENLIAEHSKLITTSGTMLQGNTSSHTRVHDDMDMNCDRQLHEDGSHELDIIDYGTDGPSTNPSERVQCALDYSSESPEEINDPQGSGPLEVEDVQFSREKTNEKEPFDISPQEMCMILKHYGLAMPNENEETLSVEGWFGSARMWPWEFIYYRRLKKGAISVENYARRVVQNEEFGIVDKYIRGSSGWGEYEQRSF